MVRCPQMISRIGLKTKSSRFFILSFWSFSIIFTIKSCLYAVGEIYLLNCNKKSLIAINQKKIFTNVTKNIALHFDAPFTFQADIVMTTKVEIFEFDNFSEDLNKRRKLKYF